MYINKSTLIQEKILEWIKRYIPAEIAATLGAIIGASSIFYLTRNRILSAYAGAIGDIIGFYIIILLRDIFKSIIKPKSNNKRYDKLSLAKDVRNILIEFGPAEILDNLIIRPFFMYLFPLFFNNYAFGILFAKVSADIIFYLPTIFSYELRKKYLK